MGGIGGIIGWVDGGTIEDCYTSGTIHGKNHVGGIAGICANSSGEKFMLIKNATSTCDIIGGSSLGGIAGSTGCDLINCHSIGSVTGESEYIGGVTGKVDAGYKVLNCSSVGDIKGNGSYFGGVGGIAGNNNGIIENCSHEGKVTNLGNYAGGIAGYMEIWTTGDTVKIIKSQQNGDVTGKRYVGGIVGYLKSGVVPESGDAVNSFTGNGTVTGTGSGNGYTFGPVYGYKP